MFLNDGKVPLGNNVIEGVLHYLCLQEYVWKVNEGIDGIKCSTIIYNYNITETAKANNLNPFCYLDYILTVLKGH